MITCPTSIAITDMPFQEYLKLDGYSHSFLKYQKNGVAESKEATVNMQIGTMVDQILTEPAKVDMSHELYKEAKQIAHSLTSTYGEMINAFKKQVSYTGVFHYAGFQLPVKGRLDFLIPKHAVVDLKVTWSKDVLALIEYMQIGTLVDQILTEPAKVDMSHELYKEAKQIAHSLTSTYGEMIAAFKKQVSYTGVFHYAGFQLPVKGRLDFLIPNHAVVDLKVTWSKDVLALIEYMGYKNQLFAYCKMAGVKKGYIMIHSAPLNKTTIVDIAIPDTNEFWQEQILNFGTVIQ